MFSLWDYFPGTVGNYSIELYMWEGQGTLKWMTDVKGKVYGI
jgi:hypothetical protein